MSIGLVPLFCNQLCMAIEKWIGVETLHSVSEYHERPDVGSRKACNISFSSLSLVI